MEKRQQQSLNNFNSKNIKVLSFDLVITHQRLLPNSHSNLIYSNNHHWQSALRWHETGSCSPLKCISVAAGKKVRCHSFSLGRNTLGQELRSGKVRLGIEKRSSYAGSKKQMKGQPGGSGHIEVREPKSITCQSGRQQRTPPLVICMN